MKFSFFRKDPALEAGEALYSAIVEQARQPVLFEAFATPDTVEGRFEQVALHTFLVLRRLKGPESDRKRVAQCLFDAMFRNMDDAMRELGVGDMAVARKIRKLAENFYGRVGAYEDGIKDGDEADTLARALGRNIFENEDAPTAPLLARYVRDCVADIEGQPLSRIIGGIVKFPAPVAAGEPA